jgi:t-SNARE complex subunit (syntaxin)
MSHNYTPECESLYTNFRQTKNTLSALAESNRALAKSNRALAKWNHSLLEENEAQDQTIKLFEKKVLELQQKLDDSEDENLELQEKVNSLKDENLELRQRVDPFSPDCLSIEDSSDEEY